MAAPTNTQNTLPPAMVTSLLSTVQRVRERGDLPRARALLRTLAEQAPGDWQVWQALADVAETDAERLAALEHLAALAAPPGPRITRPLEERGAALRPEEVPPTRASRQPPASADAARDAERWEAPRVAQPAAPPTGWFRTHRLTYIAGALVALLLLGLIFVVRDRLPARVAQPTATPPLAMEGGAPTAAPALPTLIPTVVPAEPGAGAEQPPAATALSQPPTAAPSDAGSGQPPTAAPAAPAPSQSLAVGQVVDRGDWSVTVLRPEHLMALNGSIGGMVPRGRFALALVAVSNRGAGPAVMPADLLALADSRGNRYAPLPAASTAYLSAYERGVRGDLSMEELVPSGEGIVSIPVIFDVPQDAAGLTLYVQGAPGGWAFGQ